jgi:predicted ATPase/DNA-binding XRE family transcriptional regulator
MRQQSPESPGSGRSLGELLRAFRSRSGLSQEALADRAGISAKAVGAIEQGTRRAPYRHTIAALAEALALTLSERNSLERAAARVRSAPVLTNQPLADNLPTTLTRFIEREEVSDLMAFLDRFRLVTIVGSGGVGKTRTAIEVIRRRNAVTHESSWFVDLQGMRDGNLIVTEVASALQIELSGTSDPIAGICSALAPRNLLLIFDNCEHLLDGVVRFVEALMKNCPRIRVVATSRERLGLSGEVVYRLPSLKAPNAVDLFVDRAGAADARATYDADGLDLVAEICRELDGIPLAIELAATRVATLGLRNLRARIHTLNAFSGGGSDLPQRHRTMLATIVWSYDLLDSVEQALFRRVSIFAAGFTLEMVEHVCSDDIVPKATIAHRLAGLAAKSLVDILDTGSSTRYRMLESIRRYATSLLQQHEENESMARRQAHLWADLADKVQADSFRVTTAEAVLELDNLRACLDWCNESGTDDDAVIAGRILGGFRHVWRGKSSNTEYLDRAKALLLKINEQKHPRVVAVLLFSISHDFSGDALLELSRRVIPLGEQVGEYSGLVFISLQLSIEYTRRGNKADANRQLDAAVQSLAKTADVNPQDHFSAEMSLLQHRAWIRCAQSYLDEARADISNFRDALTAAGSDGETQALLVTAEIEYASGNVSSAARLLERFLEGIDQLPSPLIMALNALNNLASYSLVLCDYTTATKAVNDFFQKATHLTPVDSRCMALSCAMLALHGGQQELAARLAGNATANYTRLGHVLLGVEHDVHRKLTAKLQEVFSADERERLMAEGRGWSIDRVRDAFLALVSEG